ncbi:uncharacterized protein [Notothenia coriiceps]|uniref:CBM21 domain-containing protein n=1 Tax=Notothenia coriiceps TaxID=8208 RepID=A0A6I9PP47_9TELE|nr:PREDICTED: uncharacterized protein LOC104962281 [Notothenia coriiceps]
MEGTHIQPMEEDGAVMEEEMKINGEQEEGEMEASEEETDEDCEPEPPHVIRRKVSFADAFGLNLVSVKEFDNVTESEVSQPPKSEATPLLEECYMSCLFTAPSSPEELDQRLQTQMVELESMELLPGTTTLRGTIRVVNLCYSKSVYARMTLDRWTSQFDLLAEYVPGSSDRKTDRFTFMYTLVPPFDREGARVEISLRYETSVGTFWANNAGLNYVLFCHQKGHVKEHVLLAQEESHIYKSKRSCLKAIMKGTAEENIEDSCNTSTAAAEAEATHKAEEAIRRGSTDIQSLLDREERKTLVDSINSRHRAARLARLKEYLSQRSQHIPKAHSHDSATSQGLSQPLPAQWVDSASFLHQRQKKQSNESPQMLTYHQIPLLTLDWNNDKAHERGAPEMRAIWTGTAKMTLSKASEEKTPSVNDVWEAFGNRTDDSSDRETSVCDVWQAFLNEPSCTDPSAVPESEWLQTAASVSPSNVKGPNARNTASSQEQELQVGTVTPTNLHAHTLAVCQLLSDSLADVALNTEDLQPAEACVSSPRDDDTVTRDTSQRSQTNSVTDTPQIFCLKGATQVSEGSVDSSTECHEHTIWGQGREEIIGGAEGKGQDEPFTQCTHDLVTSSGESETTDMTAMPESQNATADDRISQGLDEGLSSSREGEVTGSTQSMMDDKLAFTGTIRKGTKDGERFVFSTSRQGGEEGMVNSCTENKAAADEEIFRPEKREECEISRRCADEKQHGEVRQNLNSENPLQENENEIKLAQKNAGESNLSNTSEVHFTQSQIMPSEFKLDESDCEDVASNSKDFKKREMEPSYCTRDETKRLIGAEGGMVQVLNKEQKDKAFQLHSLWQRGDTSIISEEHKQTRTIEAGDVECIQAPRQTQLEENIVPKLETGVLVSNQAENESRSCDGIIEKQPDIMVTYDGKDFQGVPDSPFSTDKCNTYRVEVLDMKWTHSQDASQREDVGCEISPEEVMEKKESVAMKDTSTELQHQPETLESTEERRSHRDTDESMSFGELNIEVQEDLMGNVEDPQGERKNAPAELKEQELSAEVESSTRVEYKRLSEGTKDSIIAENTGALEVIESGLDEMFIERFGEDLISEIWEEVFGWRNQASYRDTDIVEGMGGKQAVKPDVTLFEKDLNDALSLIELPKDQTLATESNEFSPKESLSLTTAEQTNFLSQLQTDLNTSAHLSKDFTPIAAAQSSPSLTESAQRSIKDQEHFTRTKERSVTCQETSRHIERFGEYLIGEIWDEVFGRREQSSKGHTDIVDRTSELAGKPDFTRNCLFEKDSNAFDSGAFSLTQMQKDGNPKGQENYPETKERSVTRQETGRQIEEVAHREGFNQSAHPSHKHRSSSSDTLQESDRVVWWSMLYTLHHNRLLMCVLVVAGFFFSLFLYDFPAFFALYTFSLCWWFYKWKTHRVKTNKGTLGLAES